MIAVLCQRIPWGTVLRCAVVVLVVLRFAVWSDSYGRAS